MLLHLPGRRECPRLSTPPSLTAVRARSCRLRHPLQPHVPRALHGRGSIYRFSLTLAMDQDAKRLHVPHVPPRPRDAACRREALRGRQGRSTQAVARHARRPGPLTRPLAPGAPVSHLNCHACHQSRLPCLILGSRPTCDISPLVFYTCSPVPPLLFHMLCVPHPRPTTGDAPCDAAMQ